jgi:hypothetical protein
LHPSLLPARARGFGDPSSLRDPEEADHDRRIGYRTGETAMTDDVPPQPTDPDLAPAEVAYLEGEAERVFASLADSVDPETLQMMRDMFLDVAATHPGMTRLRRQVLEDHAARSEETPLADGAAPSAPPKAKGNGR